MHLVRPVGLLGAKPNITLCAVAVLDLGAAQFAVGQRCGAARRRSGRSGRHSVHAHVPVQAHLLVCAVGAVHARVLFAGAQHLAAGVATVGVRLAGRGFGAGATGLWLIFRRFVGPKHLVEVKEPRGVTNPLTRQ